MSNEPTRFGAEFGPKRTANSKGVGLTTFKNLVWISNVGGLILCAIALEMIITGQFELGLLCMVAGVIVALFPSNYEIVGMDTLDPNSPLESTDEEENKEE
jgi:hypothetical protein|tara:strand:- start:6212 stop:6514 length:303 start_codon:yes stop_codon:yes gene_type:complete